MKKLLLFIATFIMSFTVASVGAAAVYDHEVTFDMNGGDYLHSDFIDLGNKLSQSQEPITVLTIGDSTSAGSTGWLHQSAETLAAELPDYTVQYKLFDNSNLSYSTIENMQYGSQGDAYALFDGVQSHNVQALDSDEFDITSDLEISAKIDLDAGENGTIVAKKGAAGANSYFLHLQSYSDTTAILSLNWYEDGINVKNASSTTINYEEGTEFYLKVTLDVDNGAAGYTVAFSKSDDGKTYTTINEVVTSSGTTSIYNSTSPIEIGSRDQGISEIFDGKIYNVEIRDGIAGRVITSIDFDRAFPGDLESFKDTEGNNYFINDVEIGYGSPSLTFLNGSISGATSTNFNASVLDALVNIDVDMVLINLGHNEGTEATYAKQLEDFITQIKVYTRDASIVLLTQNPQITPRSSAQILAHETRTDQIRLVASRNDYALIDATEVLASDTSTYIEADGVHPTVDGYAVWADEVTDMISLGMSDNGLPEITMLVEDGELITQFDEPFKEGATFVGWYTNEALTNEWDMDEDLVQDDMTLYAKWSDSTPSISAGFLVAPDGGSLELFGITWYWYAAGAAAIYFFGINNTGRQMIGLKKRRK